MEELRWRPRDDARPDTDAGQRRQHPESEGQRPVRHDGRHRLGASVYQAFRAPTLNELYREFSFGGFTFLSNARLAPERLTGAEAKLEADLLPNGRLGARISGHYDVVKDQILLVTQGPAISQCQNIGEGRSVSLDAELRSRIHDGLWLSARYSFVDAA